MTVTRGLTGNPERVEPGTEEPTSGLSARRVTIEPWGIQVGPLGHLSEERARLAGLTFSSFDVHPMGSTIGATVTGIDLCAPLGDPVVVELERCLFAYKVLFFRDQPLTPEQHVAFASRFGPLEIHPFIPANTDRPELVRFEKDPTTGGYENGWHSDVSWRQCPSMGAVLHAVEVPPVGGDTLFSDMGAAYDGLAPEVKERVEHMTAVHDFSMVFGHTVKAEDRAAMREKYPPVEHPVIRTHPGTGRRLIYVNRFFVDHIVGLERDESDELIDLLSRQAETVEYQCRFSWEPHSVAFWDNRAVQHYASSDYWPQRRVMERASIVGERPV